LLNVQKLSGVNPVEPLVADWIGDFEKKLTELIATAKSVGKPISF
jgi:hypothetical protein